MPLFLTCETGREAMHRYRAPFLSSPTIPGTARFGAKQSLRVMVSIIKRAHCIYD